MQNGEILAWSDADQTGPPGRLTGKRHLKRLRVGNDVEVGHDVALLVPDEPGAAAPRYLGRPHAEEVPPNVDRGDEDNCRRDPLEQIDGCSLVGLERAPLTYRPRLGDLRRTGTPETAQEEGADRQSRHEQGREPPTHPRRV